MNKKTLKLYEDFKTELGEEKAMVVMDYLEEKLSQNRQEPIESKIQHLVTKADLNEAKVEILKWMLIFSIGTTTILIFIMALSN